jgi:hypothetical protein
MEPFLPDFVHFLEMASPLAPPATVEDAIAVLASCESPLDADLCALWRWISHFSSPSLPLLSLALPPPQTAAVGNRANKQEIAGALAVVDAHAHRHGLSESLILALLPAILDDAHCEDGVCVCE